MIRIADMYKREQVRNRVMELRLNMTEAEKVFEGVCKKLGIRCFAQVPFDLGQGRYRIVDFYLPRPYGLCVELDGSAHLHPEILKKDQIKDLRLKRMSKRFRVVRIPNQTVLWRGFESWLANLIEKERGIRVQKVRTAQHWARKRERAIARSRARKGPAASLSALSWKRDKRKQTPHGLHLVSGFKLADLQAMGQL